MAQYIVCDQDLDEIVARYQDMVYRIAFVRTGSSADADDVFQEVFCRFVQYAASFREEEHVKAWLITVTIRCSRKLMSSPERKNRVRYMDTVGPRKGSDTDDSISWEVESGKADSYSIDKGRESVVAAVQKLSDDDQTIIHLFYYERMRIQKIAQLLGLTEGAVKTRLSRARDRLRKDLRQHRYDA